MHQPAEHRDFPPLFGEVGHCVAPLMVVQVNPVVIFLHIIVVHVIVHRHVWQVGHIEVAEAFGEEGVQRNHRIRLDDFQPRLVEVLHVLFGDGAPLVAHLLGLDAGGFHRVGVLLVICVGHLVEVEDRLELRGRVRRNALRIVFRHARDLLQLNASAFDGVTADDRTGIREEYDAAMDEHGRQQQGDHIGLPALAVVQQRQDQRQHDDVPGVFRADQHHHPRHEECEHGTLAQSRRLAVDGRQCLDMCHMQFVPHPEPPYEREGEQWRLG